MRRIFQLLCVTSVAIFIPTVRAAAQDCPRPDSTGNMVVDGYQSWTSGNCYREPNRTTETVQRADTNRMATFDADRNPHAGEEPGMLDSGVRGLLDGASYSMLGGVLAMQTLDPMRYRTEVAVRLIAIDAMAHGIAQGFTSMVGGDSQDGIDGSNRAALAFTSAGLTCFHRQVAGGNVAECLGAVGLAVAAGGLSVLTGQGDAIDVLIGAGIGLVAGYALPLLAWEIVKVPIADPNPDDQIAGDDFSIAIAPSFSSQRGLGIRITGTF